MTSPMTEAGDPEASVWWVGLLPAWYLVFASNLELVGVVPWMFGFNLIGSDHDYQRLLQLALLASVAVVGLSLGPTRRGIAAVARTTSLPVRAAMVTVFGIGVVSSLSAPVVAAGLREVALFTLLVISGFAVAHAHRVEPDRFETVALRLMVITTSAYAFLFAIGDLAGARSNGMYGFANPRFFAQAALWIFPLVVTAAIRIGGRPAFRLGRWIAATAWWAMICESGSRAALLGLLTGFGLVAIVGGRKAWPWLRATGTVMAAGTVMWLVWFLTVGSTVGGLERMIEKGADSSGRIDIWLDTARLAMQHPWLGAGPEHTAYYVDTVVAHPHSSVLQLWAEWGTPATLLLLALASLGAWSWLRLVRGDGHVASGGPDGHTDVLSALTMALCAGGAASLLDGIIVMPVSQIGLVLVGGWALGIYQESRASTPRGTSTVAVVVTALTAVSVGLLAMGSYPYALDPEEGVGAYLEETESRGLGPRFWQVGRLDW